MTQPKLYQAVQTESSAVNCAPEQSVLYTKEMGTKSEQTTLEELFDGLGLGKAQLLSWTALLSVCLYNVSELNATFIILKYIRCEWNLDFTFELAFTVSVSFLFASGGLIFGYLSDRYGRRSVILSTVPIYIVASLLSAISPNKWMFLATKATASLFVGANFPVGTVFVTEVSSSKQKGNGIFLASATSSLGSFIVALLAFLFLNTVGWRWFVAILTLPAFLSLIAVFNLPESPWFLAVRGRNEEALNAIQKFYIWNDQKFPANLKLISYNNIRKGSIADIMGPKYRKETILLSLMYVGNFFLYFGLIAYLPFAVHDQICGIYSESSHLTPQTTSCKTLSQSDLTELLWITSASTLAVLAGYLISKIFGRNIPMKMTGLLSFTFTCTLLLCINSTFTNLVYFIIKFLSSVYNFIVSVIMLEMYPTVIRNSAVGFINFWGKTAGASSTVVVYSLFHVRPFYVLSFFLLASLVSMVMGLLWTKETKHAAYEEILDESS